MLTWLIVLQRDSSHAPTVEYSIGRGPGDRVPLDEALLRAGTAVDFEIVAPGDFAEFEVVSVEAFPEPEEGPDYVVFGLSATEATNPSRVIVVQTGRYTDLPLHPSIAVELGVPGVESWKIPGRAEIEGRAFYQFVARTRSHQFLLSFEQSSEPRPESVADVIRASMGVEPIMALP